MNKTIILNNRPSEKPQASDFKFIEEEVPNPKVGEILLQAKYVSVDPYLRGRMREGKSYIPPFNLHEPISSGIVAEVIESNNKNFVKGDFVSGMLAWKQLQTSTGKGLTKVDAAAAPLSAYLGILGMTGLTAYFGLMDIGKPKVGETIVVSGAAGAVGTIVGQIGKIKGCKVIGIAGTDEKVNLLKSKFGFDDGINYKTTENIRSKIGKIAPEGVDIYFDNVGGEISDAVMDNIARNARVVVCGAISLYNESSVPMGIRIAPTLIKQSVLMQGFTIGNYANRFPEGIKQLAEWLAAGKLTYSETIVDGFDNIPRAFMDLFEGKNKGKMVVKV